MSATARAIVERIVAQLEEYALSSTITFIAKHGTCERIVSGGAPGADTLARRYATEHAIPFGARRVNGVNSFG